MAEYRRRKRAHRRSAAPAVSATIAAVLLVAIAVSRSAPLVAAAVVASGAGVVRRLTRVPAEIDAWRRGGIGERRTAKLLRPLERRGYVVLHDLGVPGSAANLDHLVIGPTGVWLVDSKRWRGHIVVDPTGLLWHGRRPAREVLRTVWWEAHHVDQALADAGCPVMTRPVLAIHDGWLPAPVLIADGVVITPAWGLAQALESAPPTLTPS
jgi:hypothetical protein